MNLSKSNLGPTGRHCRPCRRPPHDQHSRDIDPRHDLYRKGKGVTDVRELKQPEPVSVIGPERTGNFVEYDGRIVPHLHCRDLGDHVDIIVDGRFAATFDKMAATQAVYLLAEAMAVASGYSHSGALSKGTPFAPRMSKIGEPVT